MWRLTRGLKLGTKFAWWANVGGSAVHEMTELLDRSQLEQTEVEFPSFESLMDKYEKEYRDQGMEIKASGYERAEMQWSGGPGKKDRDWWLIYGPKMVEAYERWLAQTGWELLEVEAPFDVEIDGERRVGYIDRVFITPEGMFVICDIKSGKEVVGKLQLGTYKLGYEASTGISVDYGYFIQFGCKSEKVMLPDTDENGVQKVYQRNGKTYKKGDPKMVEATVEGEVYAYLAGETDFGTYSDRYVEHQYKMMRRGLEEGIFIPNTRNCGTCPVFEWCRAVDGKQSLLVPIESIVVRKSASESEGEGA